MKSTLSAAVLGFALITVGCGKKEETAVVPPGFCRTEAECQPIADRESARLEELRRKRIAQGVHEQYLPCGTFKPTKAPNGYWNVMQDTTKCPPTASQQDPHPESSKAKQTYQKRSNCK
jgi:hypothetical protein